MKKAYGCRCLCSGAQRGPHYADIARHQQFADVHVPGKRRGKHKALAEVLNLLKGADPACPAYCARRLAIWSGLWMRMRLPARR